MMVRAVEADICSPKVFSPPSSKAVRIFKNLAPGIGKIMKYAIWKYGLRTRIRCGPSRELAIL
jgi:hypothetical protein